MKKLILAGLLLAMIAAGVVYWQMTARIETQLERAAGQLSPIGRLTWDTVSVDPRGRVLIRDLRFLPRDSRDSISIDELGLNAGSMPALLRFSDRINDGLLPRQAGISVRGLRVPITPAMENWPIQQSGLTLPLATAGCPDFEQLSLYDLTELDYWELMIDAELDYRVGIGVLEINNRVSVAELSRNRQSWRLELDSTPERLDELITLPTQARLQRVELEHTDHGFHQRLMTLCTERAGLTANQYQRRHVDAWLEGWAMAGMQPGRLVVAGYRHYLAQPESIRIIAEPAAAPLLDTLGQTSLADIVLRISPMFIINDGSPVELNITRRAPPVMPEPIEPEILTRPERIFTPPSGNTEDDDSAPPVIIVGPVPGWEEINPARISNHYGDRARIELNDGSTLRGRIVSSDDESMQLMTRSRAGQFSRPVAIDQIQKIEVRP